MRIHQSPLNLFPKDRSVNLPGFRLTKTWRPVGLRLPRHTHDHTNVSLCVSGSFEETVRERWQRVTPASLIVRPAGDAHANDYAGMKASQALIFEVLPQTVETLSTFTGVLQTALHTESERIVGLARRINSAFNDVDSASVLSIESLAYEAIALAARERTETTEPRPLWLGRVRDYIREEFRRPLAMSELADVAGVHPAHLARAFRASFGMTPGGYAREVRLSHAAAMLKAGTQPIAEIAIACGFCDQSHFTRLFKRQFGVTPDRFRRILSGR